MSTTGTGLSPVPQPGSTPSLTANMLDAIKVRTGASWFTWIAALSLVNSVVVAFGGAFHFVVGLGITAVVDEIAKRVGSAGMMLDLVINGFVAGMFFLFAHFAKQARRWAFVAGMGLYVLDALLLVLIQDYLSVAFHAYVLYRLYQGMAAIPAHEEAERAAIAAGAPIQPR